jgi:hypothetical protein
MSLNTIKEITDEYERERRHTLKLIMDGCLDGYIFIIK